MRAKLVAVFCCLGCLLFPAVVLAMSMTYEQKTGWGEPGPFPYSAVDYVFYADLAYTIGLILALRRCRKAAAIVSLPLLMLTAWLVLVAGMWFSGNYL
jgi:hypothetical protein